MIRSVSVFTGRANPELAEEICRYMTIPLGRAKVTTFSDGESFVEIEENVRGSNCFVVQPTCNPVNQNLMELLIMIDALKRASAGSIVAVIPYFGYARQDRKVKPRTPISAKLVADLISAAGADRVISMDLHAGQIQGFFNVPFDHLFALPAVIDYLRESLAGREVVIVSPDAGGVERAREFSKRLGASLAIIDKRRDRPNVSEVMNLVGSVKDKHAVLVDDLIDTAGTLTQAATVVKEHGAVSVMAVATHPVLSGPAVERLSQSCLDRIVVTNSIPLSDKAKALPNMNVLSIGKLLGEAVKRVHHGDSISSLFF